MSISEVKAQQLMFASSNELYRVQTVAVGPKKDQRGHIYTGEEAEGRCEAD